MSTEYPQEVWEAIKLLWESSPKISWRECLELVSDQLSTEVPSIVAVSQRAKREQWTKKVKSLVKKTIKKERKNSKKPIGRPVNNLNNLSNSQDADNEEEIGLNNDLKNDDNSVKKDIKKIDITPVMIIAEDAVNEAANVIVKYRTRSRRIGNMMDTALDQYDEVIEQVKRGRDIAFTDEQSKILQNQMSFTAGTIELIGKLAKSLDQLRAVEYLSYGLQLEDFKDKQTSARLEDIEDDSVYDREREKAKARYNEAMARAREVEQPDFEEKLIAEMQEQGVIITGDESEA